MVIDSVGALRLQQEGDKSDVLAHGLVLLGEAAVGLDVVEELVEAVAERAHLLQELHQRQQHEVALGGTEAMRQVHLKQSH